MIEVKRYSDLSQETKAQLDAAIHQEFGHIPIVAQTQWASPDWTIILYENEEIATFYNIVERVIRVDGKSLKIGGINNVITPPAFRKRGFATKTLSETRHLIFDELDCEMGVLLCADDLIPFYQRLGWYKVDCPVYFEQHDGTKLWGANAMFLSEVDQIVPKEVHLAGWPW